MDEEEKARKELAELEEEHKNLNKKIAAITADATFDQIAVQRMKRRKLWIKDRIFRLHEFLCDDIIA